MKYDKKLWIIIGVVIVIMINIQGTEDKKEVKKQATVVDCNTFGAEVVFRTNIVNGTYLNTGGGFCWIVLDGWVEIEIEGQWTRGDVFGLGLPEQDAIDYPYTTPTNNQIKWDNNWLGYFLTFIYSPACGRWGFFKNSNSPLSQVPTEPYTSNEQEVCIGPLDCPALESNAFDSITSWVTEPVAANKAAKRAEAVTIITEWITTC